MLINASTWLSEVCRYARKKRPLTASVAAFRRDGAKRQVLVARRKRDPYAGEWALPGGHVDKDEGVEEAAFRELEEETGLCPDDLTFVSRGIRYAGTDNERLDAVFCCEVEDDAKAEASSDVGSVKWVPVNDLPDLVFEHDEIIRKAAKMLAGDRDGLGTLVVIEGVDGSGKSSVGDSLAERLGREGYPATMTRWNSSWLVKDVIKAAKADRILTPKMFFLLHAADMVHRYEQDVVPALRRNHVVVCDRYTFTSLARDGARGIPDALIRGAYEGLRGPDVLLHCDVPVEVAARRNAEAKGLGYYSSGMDLGLGESEEECCLKYQEMLDRTYRRELPTHPAYVRLDMTESKDDAADRAWKAVSRKLS